MSHHPLTDHQPSFVDEESQTAAVADATSELETLLIQCEQHLQVFEMLLHDQDERSSESHGWNTLILLQSTFASLLAMLVEKKGVQPQDLPNLRRFLEGLYPSPGKNAAYKAIDSVSPSVAQETPATTAANDDQSLTQTSVKQPVDEEEEEEDCSQRFDQLTEEEAEPTAKRHKTF
jgi:hypothetical protein